MSRGRALGPGRLWKRGGTWVLDWTDAQGERHRQGLSADKRTAERIRADLVRRRDLELAGMSSEGGQETALSELMEIYLQDLQPRVSAGHFKNVAGRLRHVVEELGECRVQELRPMDVVRIRGQAVAEGASNRTSNLLVDRLQAMLRWAEENELIGRNPVRNLKRLPESKGHQRYRRRALTEEELGRFMAASMEDDLENGLRWQQGQVFRGGGKKGGRVRVPQSQFWITLLETGARYGELRQVTWGDVDLDRGKVVLRSETTKSKRVRAIPIRQETVELLRSLRALHQRVHGRIPRINDTAFLSPGGEPWGVPTNNLMRVLDRVLDRAGIPKVDSRGEKLDIHALRHTAATRMLRNGVGLAKAQRVLGHSDPKLTAATYGHLAVDDLRGAVDSLPSLVRDQADIDRLPSTGTEHGV